MAQPGFFQGGEGRKKKMFSKPLIFLFILIYEIYFLICVISNKIFILILIENKNYCIKNTRDDK